MQVSPEFIGKRIYKAEVQIRAQAMARDLCKRQNKRLAVPTIIFSTLAATLALASYMEGGKAKTILELLVCAMSIVVAVLMGIQQFFEFGVLAERHDCAAKDLSIVLRKWE